MHEKSRIEFARRKTALSAIVSQHTKLKRASGGWLCCCVFHKERNPSMHVSDDRQTYKCFSCGAQGDIFDFLIQTKGISFIEAVDDLAGGESLCQQYGDHGFQFVQKQCQQDDNARRIAHAHHLWLKREPIAGTVAEWYLAVTRGIRMPHPDILGYTKSAYCSVLGEETEALIAPLQDSRGHVTAVQQIFLSRETGDAWRDDKGKRVKRTLGAMLDGCVRLGVPDTVLGLAGSVEDALAASSLYSLPVWATCGEQRMSRVWVPSEVEHVLIFADADEPGQKAAQEAKSAHQAVGRAVAIVLPEAGKDWCETTERRAKVA